MLGMLASNKFPCSSKANLSSLSRLAIKLLVYLLPLLLKGLERECGANPINVLQVISSMSY